jgi:hypothetical protein
MKLRLHENSVRLRLNRSEVRQLQQTGSVGSSVEFAGGRLDYLLRVAAGSGPIEARFQDGRIEIVIPPDLSRAWASSDDVSIESSQPVRPGVEVNILIEKDFSCLHSRSGGQDEDTFPNPAANRLF